MKKSYLFLLALVILFASPVTSLRAEALSDGPSGITVSPAYQSIQIHDAATTQPVNFSITNNENTTQTINFKTIDFNALSNTGGLLFVGSNPTQIQKEYGLAKWLTLPISSLTLAPKQSSSFTLDIDNRTDLAPGGHYGALMLYLQNSGGGGDNKNKVAIDPVASSLMFVTKLGGATYRMSLTKVSLAHNLFNLPGQAVLRFHDDGNTQLVPRGLITVTDPSGKLVSKGVINTNSSLILPQNYRYYTVPLKSTAEAGTIGSYKVNIYYRFDGFNGYRRYQTSVYYGTPKSIVIAVMAVVVIILAAIQIRRRFRRTKNKTK